MKLFYDPSIIFELLLPNYFWRTTNGKILVTFDDGPQKDATELALQCLAENKISALFFLLGKNYHLNVSLAKEILSQGHRIGIHMNDHKILMLKSYTEIEQEISQMKNMLEDDLGIEAKYFRPPRGIFTFGLNSILKKLKMQNVMWSLLTKDYNNDLKVVKFALAKYLTNNSIVVFHDRVENKTIIKDSINYLIETATKNNFTIGKAPDCLK